jgi:tellurite resistance protein TehA-like permease
MPAATSERFWLCLERWHPPILGLIGAGLALLLDFESREGFKDVLQATVNLSAILIGFLATAKSILFTIGDRETVRAMKKSGHWAVLIRYMMTAIYAALILAVLSGSILLVKFLPPEDWHRWVACLWAFCLVWTLAACGRVVRFFAMLLNRD